jgi:para-nitrobenzyl esterase
MVWIHAKTELVYAYEFNDCGAPAPEPLQQLPFQLGASHSLELRYLFDLGGAPSFTPAQRALSDQMIDYLEPIRQHRVAEHLGPAGVA